jgi:hypothetical protein
MGVENNNNSILSEDVRATAIMAHPYPWDIIGRFALQFDYRRIFKKTVMIMALVKSMKNAPTMDTTRKAWGALP